jgi:hypothetical protein
VQQMAIFTVLKATDIIHPRYIRQLLVMILIGCGIAVHAQNKQVLLTGVVYNKDGSQRVNGVVITDMVTGVVANSDELGAFKISCNTGDTLLFKQKSYTDQKIKVVNNFVLVVYMQPSVTLKQVDIKDVTKKQELAEVMNDYNKKGVYNGGKASVLSNIFHPLNALFNIFGSDAKNARRFQNDATNELQQQEVSRKFTVALVQQVTGLKDVKLKNFMDSYRPTYQDCRNWNEYDAISYIKISYEKFEKDGEPALPKLY